MATEWETLDDKTREAYESIGYDADNFNAGQERHSFIDEGLRRLEREFGKRFNCDPVEARHYIFNHIGPY